MLFFFFISFFLTMYFFFKITSKILPSPPNLAHEINQRESILKVNDF